MKQALIMIIIFFLATSVFTQTLAEKGLLEKLNADQIEMDQENQDGTFKARNKTSKKWGIFQLSSTLVEMIPMKYDSLEFFEVNAKFTVVYDGGKLGIYLCYFDYDKDAKQTVPCLYEDFKKMIVPYNGDSRFPPITYTEEYLAAKKDGKWGWINWFTGEEMSEFIYDSPDELPTPDYLQEWM